MSETAYIALGSNWGDERRDYLEQAIAALAATPGVVVVRRSSVYETKPVGGPADQEDYLNAVVEVTTTLPPEKLLERLLSIEKELGRVRTVKDGPRTIDLDLLLQGKQVRDEPALTLPHPRLHQRLFVLEPLAEIAPGVIHPVLDRSVAELRAELLGVRPAGPSPGRELAGLRALVTGSTSGIGRAVALELAAGGAHVLIHGRRSQKTANEVADAADRLAGVECACLLADLRDPAECDRLAEDAWQTWGGLDVLVNNAGADTLTGAAARWPFEDKLEALWDVDVKATIHLSRTLGRQMKEAGGVIVNMGWDQAEAGMAGDSGELFAAAKGAVMSFTRSLALSLAPEVRVNCVAPGWVRTAWGENASEKWQERVRKETPLGVWGRPEDVARLVRWLVSPAASYMTGQIVRVNGGAVR
jgi:2-amino-4-hydroxy-6-hydroxymethyldihydropteridine diphosphokinase